MYLSLTGDSSILDVAQEFAASHGLSKALY